jgi:soluble lytic murein transglycosylase
MPKITRLFLLTSLFFLAALLMAGCGGTGSGIEIEQTNPFDGAPELLPTPTPAVAIIAGDPLRPPTPEVFPSPTPNAGLTSGSHDSMAITDNSPDTGEMSNETGTTNERVAKSVTLPPNLTPLERLELGRTTLAEGDFARAAAAFRAAVDDPQGLSDGEAAEAQLGLAVALLEEGEAAEAVPILTALQQNPAAAKGTNEDTSVQPLVITDVAAYHLGRAQAQLGDHAAAIEAYSTYLQANPEMAAYIGPLMADTYLALNDTDGAIAALEIAVEGPAQRFKAVENRLRLARFYMAQGNAPAAIAQYDAIHDIARTEATKGQMTFLAGQAELQAGNTDAAYDRYLFGVENYPRAAETHQGLVALVNAGIPVDDYQRGVVNFYAGVYIPAIEAFRRHIAAEPENYQTDSRLFIARSYEGLGDLSSALAELNAFAGDDPPSALFERAEMLARAADISASIEAYDAFLADYSGDDRVATALWAVARLADRQTAEDTASRYLALADQYPFDPNTPRALYRAGELSETGERLAIWQRLGEQYPANEAGAEALFRLWQLAHTGEADDLEIDALRLQIEGLSPSNYFALRVRDLVAGVAPFIAAGSMVLPMDEAADQSAAEAWLRERLPAGNDSLPSGSLAVLSGPLATDPQRIIGEKLWQLGLFEAAKAELELVRETYAGDPLGNYQMAIYFRDLGLYRSSIIAAAALLRQVEATIYDAPPFLGRLSFPVYYADLILPLAEQYGFDPRLQFALVRQESLFESFARSGAAAQGLSQVIPDTGAWIAQRLQWPDYKNEDLYKPYVGLHFGSYYLSEQLRGFDNHVHAALAAYNGGPGNAARWFQTAGGDLDQFVDTVNFPETRLYIERIYEGFNAYRTLYAQP